MEAEGLILADSEADMLALRLAEIDWLTLADGLILADSDADILADKLADTD